jgi:glyoxylase-like metal-dependent hydrolase (beta-lactamase superfamily II)
MSVQGETMPRGSFGSRGLRRCLIGGLTVLILALALSAAYRSHSIPTAREPKALPPPAKGPTLEPRPVTLAPGLHLLGGLAPAAAYVVETSSGLVLIDTGLEANARSLKEQMASLDLDWRRVRAILLTHAHGDHSGGAEHLREATGATVYAGEGDAAVLRAAGPREALYSTFYVPQDVRAVPTRVDVELHGDERIEVGDARFRVLATPGHTPGSVCYLMERDHQRVLFAGDVILSLARRNESRSPYARPLGTYPAYLAPRYRGDGQAFLRTLRSLRALPGPDLVLPGHPRDDAAPQNPAMTQSRWEALLDPGIQELEQLLDRYARDGALFLDDVPKKLLPDLYYLGDFKGVAVYGFFASSRFFLVNAPGGSGLSAFVTDRVGRLGLKTVTPTAVLLTSTAAETAGLKELVDSYHCCVVAADGAQKAIEDTCPAGTTIIGPDELSRRKWFDVEPVLPGGPRAGSLGYLLRWESKRVLFSGRIPIRPPRAAQRQTMRELVVSLGGVGEFLGTLNPFRKLRPDLWLPAVPADGQNANLDAGEWSIILAQNEDIVR